MNTCVCTHGVGYVIDLSALYNSGKQLCRFLFSCRWWLRSNGGSSNDATSACDEETLQSCTDLNTLHLPPTPYHLHNSVQSWTLWGIYRGCFVIFAHKVKNTEKRENPEKVSSMWFTSLTITMKILHYSNVTQKLNLPSLKQNVKHHTFWQDLVVFLNSWMAVRSDDHWIT